MLDTPLCFLVIFFKKEHFRELLACFTERCSHSEIGSPLIGKNLLLEEQILHLRGPHIKRGKMKMSEMLSLRVYSFTLRG